MKKMRYLALAICSLLLTSCSNSIPYEEMNNFETLINLNEWDTHVLTVNSSYDLSEGTFDYNNKVYSFDSDEIDYIHYTVYAGVLKTRENDTFLPTREEILDYTEEQRKEHKFTYDGSIDVKSVTGDFIYIVDGSDIYLEFGYILDGPIINFLLAGEYHIIADVAFNDEQYISVDLGYYYVYDPETITYINTIDDFMDINTYGGYYYLNADLDFEGIDFKTIFHYHSDRKYNKFLFINPDNHVIKNITINEVYTEDDSISNWCGIFFYVDGYMDGLIIDNLNITYKYIADIDLGVVGGIAHSCSLNSIFKNCHINGNIEAINCDSVGGLIGFMYNSSMTSKDCPPYSLINCSFNGIINHTLTDNYSADGFTFLSTGGLVGYNERFWGSESLTRRKRMKGETINYPFCSVVANIVGPKYVGGFGGYVWNNDISFLTEHGYYDSTLRLSKYFDYHFDNFDFSGVLNSANGYETGNLFGAVTNPYNFIINNADLDVPEYVVVN